MLSLGYRRRRTQVRKHLQIANDSHSIWHAREAQDLVGGGAAVAAAAAIATTIAAVQVRRRRAAANDGVAERDSYKGAMNMSASSFIEWNMRAKSSQPKPPTLFTIT
jgi:hypothetical protein